jgi:SAM-dependent MidA family methyltransferase
MAEVVARLLAKVDDALGRPAPLAFVDAGAGEGQLLAALAAAAASPRGAARGWPGRLVLHGIDVRPRPAALPERIVWTQGRAPGGVPAEVVGVLWAHELLDDVPCDVVQVAADGGPRLVEVAGDGDERLGEAPGAAAEAWLERWWPLGRAAPGDRAEVGLARDDVWRGLCARLAAGAAVAVDYAHARADRAAGRWARGTLVGYRHGRAVRPVPDGSCNLTAHVSLDACAAAVSGPDDHVVLTAQADAVRRLVAARSDQRPLPPPGSGPERLRAIAAASSMAALRDPAGPGSFGWLELRRATNPEVSR